MGGILSLRHKHRIGQKELKTTAMPGVDHIKLPTLREAGRSSGKWANAAHHEETLL